MNKWLNSELIFAAVLIGALGLVGCGDDGPCASCPENVVKACERAVEICDNTVLDRDVCIRAAQRVCERN